MLAIIDYKAGNLTSVRNAFAALGVEAAVTADPETIRRAERVVFPGVGAAGSAMANLVSLGLLEAVREAAGSGRPFLGICLGMQILFERSEEDGGVETLGILPGQVRRFPDVPGFKVPEIGWNQVERPEGVAGDAWTGWGREYYFVHSYYAETGACTVGTTEYAGVTFTSAVRRGGLVAYQFHPEKSGRTGLALLEDFLKC